jgi:two-component system, NtrC family, sensor histidine kinase HydH
MRLPRIRKNARIGWLATTSALAIALIVGSWLNYRGAVAAVSTLNRGQADLLELAIREVVQPGAPLDSATLRDFLEAHTEAGLRYVALLSSDGRITASAGHPLAPAVLPQQDTIPGDERALIDLGNRMRAYFPRPPVQGEMRGRFGGRAGPGPDDDRQDDRRIAGPPEVPIGGEPRRAGQAASDANAGVDADAADGADVAGDARPGDPGGRGQPRPGAGRGFRPAYHLLEFEPVVASGLVTRATRAMALAGVAATILTLAAFAFWRTAGEYESARLRLEEQRRLTQLGEMSAVLAHEIRNPLASLKGNAQLLAERTPAESREHARVERVVREATRLEALTSDLLDFARAGPIELRPADPVEVLHNAITDVDAEGFDVDAADAPADWPMDMSRVRQALVNVLQNARQAAPDGARPDVRVAAEKATLVFEVHDHGPGIPAGNEIRIFDPFFTTRTNGTGLGLAVARRVAEMHGGGISAHNHPDGGAVFRIALPRTAG